nr:tetratricopeptide repeat protein [Polymorphobacter sp.]
MKTVVLPSGSIADFCLVGANATGNGLFRGITVLVAVAVVACPGSVRAAVAPDAASQTAEAHLKRGLALFESGNYARARIEFESVLRLDGQPANLYQQAEVYADAARAYLAGDRLLPTGYVVAGYGHYAENDTIAGTGDANDNFFSARIGGRINYAVSPSSTINASLDYRYRNYDNGNRRKDSDLRWNGNVSHMIGDNNLAVGVRGWASARGAERTRNDYGVFGEFRLLGDPDSQFRIGAEVRRRDYPSGPLRERSRNIVDVTGGWTRSLLGGKASFSLAGGIGREFATDDRPDGNSNFFTLSPSLDFTLSKALGGHVFAWWQRDRYNLERINSIDGEQGAGIPLRSDNLWEVGGGLSWAIAKGWSLNPDVLYIKDDSNILAANYSATELHLTLRKDF